MSTDNKEEEFCKCSKIIGHLEAVKWYLWPMHYKPSPNYLALGDWTKDPFIWMHYVESNDGTLHEDDVLQTTNSRYWDIHDVQRYFVGELHCEQVLFTYQYPNLRMPTRLGSYFWKANAATKLPSKLYQKELHCSLEITLKKMEAQQVQLDRLIISDQLIKLNRLDCFKRQTFFRILMNIMSFQKSLQLVSFENLCCKRLEGVRLIQQLACFNADTLKYLFLWRFVLPNENPLLINYSYITGSGKHIPRPDTKWCFLRSLGELRNLRILGLEYSHIADGTGGALLALLPVLKRTHFRLQLICREDQIPGRADAALGVGGYGIPDTAWRRVAVACPELYLLMVFFRVRDYDNVRRFLTPSIPLREVHLQYGIDLEMRQRQDSDISCFVRHIAFRYADILGAPDVDCSSLVEAPYMHCHTCLKPELCLPCKGKRRDGTVVTLSIHQWRFACFPLRRVFELMPRLTRFFYVGRVEDEVDLQQTLQIVACGVCDKLKQITIQIQDEEIKRDYWNNVVEKLTEEYKDAMELLEIQLCLSVYKT